MINKQLLRAKFKKIRDSLNGNFIKNASNIISQRLSHELYKHDFNIIAAYIPINNEVDVITNLKILNQMKIALPVIKEKTLKFFKWDKNVDIIKKGFCYEPDIKNLSCYEVIPDIIIVPVISFDRKLNRLGYGKGFYDRAFSDIRYHNALKIGVAYSIQEFDNLVIEDHDIKLNMIITEKEIIYS